MEIFRSALSSFSGLMRLGTVVFRWAALASLIVSLTTVPFSHRGVLIIPDIAYALMRSVSILELCLLAFLCLSMNALASFGARHGIWHSLSASALMSANDFILASFWSRNTSLTSPLQFVYESLILLTLWDLGSLLRACLSRCASPW